MIYLEPQTFLEDIWAHYRSLKFSTKIAPLRSTSSHIPPEVNRCFIGTFYGSAVWMSRGPLCLLAGPKRKGWSSCPIMFQLRTVFLFFFGVYYFLNQMFFWPGTSTIFAETSDISPRLNCDSKAKTTVPMTIPWMFLRRWLRQTWMSQEVSKWLVNGL